MVKENDMTRDNNVERLDEHLAAAPLGRVTP
jgi:hypothetical protein